MRILLTSSAAAVAEAKRLDPDAVVLDLDEEFNRAVDALMPDASDPPP